MTNGNLSNSESSTVSIRRDFRVTTPVIRGNNSIVFLRDQLRTFHRSHGDYCSQLIFDTKVFHEASEHTMVVRIVSCFSDYVLPKLCRGDFVSALSLKESTEPD